MHVATRREPWRFWAGVALALCLTGIWWPVGLLAHAELLRTEPAAGAVVPSAPTQVRLWFSEPVDPPADAVVVVGPDGVRADRRDSRIVPGDEGAIDVSVNAQVLGTYVVRWRAISADSHPIGGEFQFSVGQPSEAASGTASPSQSQPTRGISLQASARWLHLLALALLVGPLALLALSLATSSAQGLDAALWRGSRWGGLLLLPAALLSLLAQSAAVAGSTAEGLQPAALLGLLHTRWGALWMVRVAFVVIAAMLTSVAARRPSGGRFATWWLGAMLVVSAALIALTALNSHSAATAPVWLSIGVDCAHIAATAVWIGGLCSLTAIVFPGARTLDVNLRQAVVAPLVSRFSVVALVSVEVLVLTGLYHAWAHVSDPGALTSTPYGQVLLIKLLLVAAMMAPAAFNLLVATPRLRASQPPRDHSHRWLTRSVQLETVLGVLVLGAVGLLTSLPPAQSVSAASPPLQPSAMNAANEPTVTLAAPAGRVLVTLTVGPGRVGSNHIDVRLQDDRGAPVTDAEVKLRILPPEDSHIQPWVVVPATRADHRDATVALAPEGRWGLNVEVTRGADMATASFSLSVPLRGAGELLAAALDRMNRLHSVTEETEMVMNGVASTERAERTAPLNYRWLESATEVTLLGREIVDGDECFVISYVDTRDGSRTQVWIATGSLYVVRRSAAVPGHLHISRFSKFDGVSRRTQSPSGR